MIVKGWIKSSLCAAVAAVALPALTPWIAVPPQAAYADDQALQQNIDQQSRVLFDPQASIGQKEEAARLLVERADAAGGEAARKALVDVLSSGKHDSSQIAVARALALDSHPADYPPDYPADTFINLLAPLLGREHTCTEAAARALANYQDNPHALAALVSFVNDHRNDDVLRATVIRAMGNIVDKQAVIPLMQVVQSPQENPAVASAACDALMEITGHEDFAHDVPRWIQWWNDKFDASASDLKTTWLTDRLKRSTIRNDQLDSLREHLYTVLSDAYSRVGSETARTELSLHWLNDPEPAIKLCALHIVSDSYTKTGIVPEAIKVQLRLMVGDSSRRVRLEAVRTIQPINDAGALDALLKQLKLETDADVEAEIAKTLGPLQDVQAVDPLLGLLSGERPLRVREAAALGLATMGEQIRAAHLERPVAQALEDALNWAQNKPGTQTFRENIMEALSKLRLWDLRAIFEESSKNIPRNTTELRRTAYLGLGNIDAPDPGARDDIANNLATDLTHETDNPSVELAIIEAIGKIGTINQAKALLSVIKVPGTPADMCDSAWQAIKGFFGKAGVTPADLAPIITEVADIPTYQRDALTAQVGMLQKTNDDNLAIARQNLGQTDVRLGKFDEAATNFQAAWDYWNSKGLPANDATVEELTHQLFKSRLSARQYDQAVKLGGQSIAADQSLSDYFGVAIENEVERLQKAGDVKAARDLIDAADAMHPPLPANYIRQLHEAREHPIPPSAPGSVNE